MIVHGKIS